MKLAMTLLLVGACGSASRPTPSPTATISAPEPTAAAPTAPAPTPPRAAATVLATPAPAQLAPVPTGAPTAAELEAAPNMLAQPTRGCTVKIVRGHKQIRCPLATDGAGLLDVAHTRAATTGGIWNLADGTATWTVEQTDEKANPFMFDDGVFELATRPRDGRSEWYPRGTYKPGAVKLLRRTMTCCLASHPASECFGQQLLSEATACEAKRGCAAFDTCIQQRMEKRRAKACKPPAHEDCFL